MLVDPRLLIIEGTVFPEPTPDSGEGLLVTGACVDKVFFLPLLSGRGRTMYKPSHSAANNRADQKELMLICDWEGSTVVFL